MSNWRTGARLPRERNIINLCIPRIHTNNISYIKQIFEKLNFGDILKIDCIPVGAQYKAFIHYRSWNHTEKNNKVLDRLKNNLLVGVVYSQPWYWRVRLAR